MLAISNPFYLNPEANARQLLQQQMQSDAQRRLQQSLTEQFFLRSLLSQGHLCLCIPLYSFPIEPILHDNWQLTQFQQAQQPSLPCPPQQPQKSQPTEVTKETKLRVTLGNKEHRNKVPTLHSGAFPAADECKFKTDCVEIVVNLRHLLPAEICINVEESSIRVEVNRVDGEGLQNMWRHYNLPACVQTEAAKCILSHDGFLHISVPWCKMES